MRKYFSNEAVLENCKIFRMLDAQAKKEHASFHTPGHKRKGWDITELSYSDNLSSPKGCILEAERDIAEILGAYKSFILTDGSTCGVFSMLFAAKTLGIKTVAFCEASHKSIYNGCLALGLTPLPYPQKTRNKIPFAPTMSALNEEFSAILEKADALFLTSPDYYGNAADLRGAREYCNAHGKLLLVDGAHGGHLHFEKSLHANGFADMWVDGVHKSLPAFTQGAVVSASECCAEALRGGVDVFRTTSPSYPIMASVEYAVKYPRNKALEKEVRACVLENSRLYQNDDWTKLCATFGAAAFEVEKILESEGVFAEFCDGNVLTFYLSPATTMQEFTRLKARLTELFARFPLGGALHEAVAKETGKKEVDCVPAPVVFEKNAATEWVELCAAVNRICAYNCGLFPPCTPLISVGEKISAEKIELLLKANNVFGLSEGKILVLKA